MSKTKSTHGDSFDSWLEDYHEFWKECKDKRSTDRFLKGKPHLVNSPHHLLLEAARDCKPQIVKAFIDAGDDLNQQDKAGWTALANAIRGGNLNTVRLLLQHGASPNDGWALSFLADPETPHRLTIFQHLVDLGVDVNQDLFSHLPMWNLHSELKERKDDPLFQLLLKHGGRPPKTSNKRKDKRRKAEDPLPAAIEEWKARRGRKAFEASGDGLKDLDLLSELRDLKSLSIDGDQVIDYKPLKSLTKLKSLTLRSDCHSNLTPLASLKELEELHITDGPIRDLSPLGKLERLKTLSFHWCAELTNIRPLSKLKKLERLTFYECTGVLDLRPLASCTNLRKLEFIDCFDLADVTPLAQLNTLRHLTIANTAVTDVSSLSRLSKLKISFKDPTAR